MGSDFAVSLGFAACEVEEGVAEGFCSGVEVGIATAAGVTFTLTSGVGVGAAEVLGKTVSRRESQLNVDQLIFAYTSASWANRFTSMASIPAAFAFRRAWKLA